MDRRAGDEFKEEKTNPDAKLYAGMNSVTERMDASIDKLVAHVHDTVDKHTAHVNDIVTYHEIHIAKVAELVEKRIREADDRMRKETAENRQRGVAVFFTCILLLLTQGFEIYFETIRLGAWRQTGRNIQVDNGKKLDEVLDRVRAHDAVFGRKPAM